MLKEMAEIIERLKSNQAKRSEAIQEILKAPIESNQFLEGFFFKYVNAVDLNHSVAGVDSSIIGQEFMSADLLMVKSVSTIITYKSGTKQKSIYYPSVAPEPLFVISEGLDAHEVIWHKNLVRLTQEYSIACELATKKLADVILLDGSIIPLVLDRPAEDSQLYEKYLELIRLVVNFFKVSEQNNVLVAGLSKDSRSKRVVEIFKDMYQNKASIFTNDVSLLYEILPAGSRTTLFSYESQEATKKSRNLVIKDLEKAGFAGVISAYYQRISKYDKPIRVEVISSNKSAGIDAIAGIIHSLCSISKRYTYPAVLIDADLRAKVEARDLDRMIRVLSVELLQGMRRQNRPFR